MIFLGSTVALIGSAGDGSITWGVFGTGRKTGPLGDAQQGASSQTPRVLLQSDAGPCQKASLLFDIPHTPQATEPPLRFSARP